MNRRTFLHCSLAAGGLILVPKFGQIFKPTMNQVKQYGYKKFALGFVVTNEAIEHDMYEYQELWLTGSNTPIFTTPVKVHRRYHS